MSASERVLWELLRNKGIGFSFRRQLAVGPYFLDFYCAEARLCVEVDGEQHAQRSAADAYRDGFLESRGIETLRLRSLDLFDVKGVLKAEIIEKIRTLCEERSGRLAWQERKARSRPASTP
jgi:very-short-patch-repair endonuclease